MCGPVRDRTSPAVPPGQVTWAGALPTMVEDARNKIALRRGGVDAPVHGRTVPAGGFSPPGLFLGR